MRAVKALAGLSLVVLLSGCCAFGDSSQAQARPVDWCIATDHQSDYLDLKELLESNNMYSVAPCGSGIDANYRFEVARYAKKNGEIKLEVVYPSHEGRAKTFPIYGKLRKNEKADQAYHRLFKLKWQALQGAIGNEKL